MPELRAVLFDLDGVLVNSYEAWFKLVNLAARHFCKLDVSAERFQKSWGQGLDADQRDFFPGCDAQQVERFYEDHLLDFDACMQVDGEAVSTLRQLRDAGIPRGIVTNTPIFLARDILAWAGLIGLVDVTSGAVASVAPKPAPDLIVRACRELQVEPRAVLVVGDSRFDAQAARAAQAHFVGFRTGEPRSISKLSDVIELMLSQAG